MCHNPSPCFVEGCWNPTPSGRGKKRKLVFGQSTFSCAHTHTHPGSGHEQISPNNPSEPSLKAPTYLGKGPQGPTSGLVLDPRLVIVLVPFPFDHKENGCTLTKIDSSWRKAPLKLGVSGSPQETSSKEHRSPSNPRNLLRAFRKVGSFWGKVPHSFLTLAALWKWLDPNFLQERRRKMRQGVHPMDMLFRCKKTSSNKTGGPPLFPLVAKKCLVVCLLARLLSACLCASVCLFIHLFAVLPPFGWFVPRNSNKKHMVEWFTPRVKKPKASFLVLGAR